MKKERLEEMKELLNEYYEDIDDPFASTDNTMAIVDRVGYFVNRVQELEENNIALLEALRFQDEDLTKQNKAYREVLDFYGNKDNYMKYVGMQPITPTIEIDSGKKAREVITND